MKKMIELEKLATLYWAITVPLLVVAIVVRGIGFLPAFIMVSIQMLHFYYRAGSFNAFPVQVRMAYLLILLSSTAPYSIWIAWTVLIGTIARVLFNYCFLARLVSLLPWNRIKPLSWALVGSTFLTPPTKGSILALR